MARPAPRAAGPPPKKIIAALEHVCKARIATEKREKRECRITWPLKYPTPYGITATAQDYAFLMEVHSVFATSLGWNDLLLFVGEATGKTPKRVDWSQTYREALSLVHAALGISDNFEDEVEPRIPNRESTLQLFGITPDQLSTKEKAIMAKTKQPVTSKNKSVAVAAKPVAKAVSKSESAPAKPTKAKIPVPKTLPADTLGGLSMAAAFLEGIADYANQAKKETDDPRVAELHDLLMRASTLLDKIVG